MRTKSITKDALLTGFKAKDIEGPTIRSAGSPKNPAPGELFVIFLKKKESQAWRLISTPFQPVMRMTC
jgi:hypothetical protein